MCISTPYKIIKIKGQKAVAKSGKASHKLDIRLLPKVKAGDWVLAENGFVVAKLSVREAIENLKLISQ